MPHRRLVLALAITIGFALLALVVVVIPAFSLPTTTISTSAPEPIVYTGPSTGPREMNAAIAAAVRTKSDNDGRWYAEAARQEQERVEAEAARTSARGTDRTGSASTVDTAYVPTGSGDARAAIAAHFGDIYDSAIGVAQCESSLDPGSVSKGGGNWGLFQINTVHRDDFEQFTGKTWEAAILNADANAAYARKLYDGNGGWGPWACRWAA